MRFVGTRRFKDLNKLSIPRGWHRGTWGMVAAAAITTGGAMAMGGGGGGGGQGGGGGGVVTMPQYSFTEPRLGLTSDFVSQGLQNLQEGKEAPYLQAYKEPMRRGLQEGLSTTYFGQPGRRGEGAYARAMEAGSITGIGPKATIAQGGKALQDYTRKSKSIDDYIAGLYFSAQQEAAMTLPQISSQIPGGPNAQAFAGQPAQARPNYMGEALGDIASNIPWENMFQGSQTPYQQSGGYIPQTFLDSPTAIRM